MAAKKHTMNAVDKGDGIMGKTFQNERMYVAGLDPGSNAGQATLYNGIFERH